MILFKIEYYHPGRAAYTSTHWVLAETKERALQIAEDREKQESSNWEPAEVTEITLATERHIEYIDNFPC